MADQLERITNLLALLLETRAPLTLDAIAAELRDHYPAGEAARRGAFERDKALLRDVGVPIETSVGAGEIAGQTLYSIDRQRYELGDLQLSPDEERALQVAVAMVRNSDAAFGLLKLGADGAAVPTTVVTAALPHDDLLPPLRDAAAQRRAVRFQYRAVSRAVDPYSLMLRGGFWYLIGFDHAHQEIRTFRVDRIDGAVIADAEAGTFERPPDFDPAAQFPADARELGGERWARVRIDAPRAAMVVIDSSLRRVADHTDGSVDVDVPCANVAAFRSWLFEFGEHAEVLSPAEVRADVVAWLQAMVAQ